LLAAPAREQEAMSEDFVSLCAAGRWSARSSLLLLMLAAPVFAQPHADVPLPIPQFSVDRQSSIAGTAIPPSSILTKPGPMVRYPGTNFGLMQQADELNDFTYNRAAGVSQTPTFILLFSVDPQSLGARPPEAGLTATGRCFNVQEQAGRHQVPADLFMTTDTFNAGGPIGPKGSRTTAKNNTAAVNQWDTGGVDDDLSPAKSPEQTASPTEPADDVDGVAYESDGTGKSRGLRLYFTVSSDSPSLPYLSSSQPSGGDIFTVADPSVVTTIPLDRFATAANLGLTPADDIAALVVLDYDPVGVLTPGVDEVLFTLARGSPSLGMGQYSPADILVSYGSYGNGVFSLYASADDLGLLPTDHLDALEVIPTENPEQSVYEHAIFRVWPGDYDKSGSLDQTDCSAFAGCYSGPGISYDTNGPMVHVVQVGPGYAFHPSTINVEVGDTVRWIWVDGPHNVVSGEGGVPDGVFESGPPAFPPATYDVVFSELLLEQYLKAGWEYWYFSWPDLSAGMVGRVIVHAHPCAVFDLDYDGDVDCADWPEFNAVYAEATGGGTCLPGIPEFVAVLLGMSSLPGDVCTADINGDGWADGLDVQAYVDAILP
jgi:plastocyanin